MDTPKVKNENAVKDGKALAAARKAKRKALISELNRLKEMNLLAAEKSIPADKEPVASPPLDEEKKQTTLTIFGLSFILVVVAGIYFYKTNSPHIAPAGRTSTPATTSLVTVTSLIPVLTQKDVWTIYLTFEVNIAC